MRLRTSSQQQQKSTSIDSGTKELIKTEPNEITGLALSLADKPGNICGYCGELRKLGVLEVCCSVCKKWFHQACFKNLENFGGLPFMVSYVFCCQSCSTDKQEKWTLRNTSVPAMAVMTLANMTLDYRLKQHLISDNLIAAQNPYFNIDKDIVPYMDNHWEYLSTSRRHKKNWKQTITKILQRETDLFEQDSTDEFAFALKEKDLHKIGPMHESVLQLFKRNRDAVEREANALQIGEQQLGCMVMANEGPKTRGASKRKAVAATTANGSGSENSPKPQSGSGPQQKKMKMAAEFATVQIDGQLIDFPFNREGYRYYLVEKDPNIPNRERFDTEEVSNTRAVQIPSHIYRIVIPSTVFLSPNDRANQLSLDYDNLTITGHEGYAMARATHSVSHGTWYYEMEFLQQLSDSQTIKFFNFHVRIGWSQSNSVLQACVGYSKFSYGWRSKKGTIFHDGNGKHYSKGFGQGDIIGCLIHLPSAFEDSADGEISQISEILPASKKECDLIKFKQTCFFEEKEEIQQALQRLKPLKNSRIEFFFNGQSCGVAFNEIFAGHYFPAVSIFQAARVRLNFGPEFRIPPECVRDGQVMPISARPEQLNLEQTIADLAYMVANESELEQKNVGYFDAILTKENN